MGRRENQSLLGEKHTKPVPSKVQPFLVWRLEESPACLLAPHPHIVKEACEGGTLEGTLLKSLHPLQPGLTNAGLCSCTSGTAGLTREEEEQQQQGEKDQEQAE